MFSSEEFFDAPPAIVVMALLGSIRSSGWRLMAVGDHGMSVTWELDDPEIPEPVVLTGRIQVMEGRTMLSVRTEPGPFGSP